jgi:hypothetical protein
MDSEPDGITERSRSASDAEAQDTPGGIDDGMVHIDDGVTTRIGSRRQSRYPYGTRPGRFQSQVTLSYRKWTSRIEQFKHFVFRLQSGTIVKIVKRDDRTLVLRLDNREMAVGRHSWWYSPYWQAADGVQIACDRDRRFRRVVLENCRLIVS